MTISSYSHGTPCCEKILIYCLLCLVLVCIYIYTEGYSESTEPIDAINIFASIYIYILFTSDLQLSKCSPSAFGIIGKDLRLS